MPICNDSFLNTTATHLLTDSRKAAFPDDSIFFAIKGERHNGHEFIDELYKKGVRQFVIETKALDQHLRKALNELADTKIWEVEDAVHALQQLATQKRNRFKIPVIGITGSNGKTIVKEWLWQLLSSDYEIVRSPKSYNSQIGVPLSVWQMNEKHSLGIFEAGLSKPHEIELLEKIIQPTIGIFTNIGSAHDEGFRSRKQKISEKLKLFTHTKKFIYCADYQDIDNEVKLILKAVNPDCELIGWSKGAEANVKWKIVHSGQSLAISQQEKENSSLRLDSSFNIHHPTFNNPASLENLTHCIVMMLELGIAPTDIQQRIDRLKPVSMRLELKQGIQNCYLIDDTYNNDLVGLTMALDFLKQQDQRPNSVVILSDLLQTGQKESDLYEQIAILLKEKAPLKLIAIGAAFKKNGTFFDSNTLFYDSTEAFLAHFPSPLLRDATVLVKGARVFKFEKIVHRLQQKTHGTVLETNLDAITHNLNHYRSLVGKDTKIMVMVKAFGYGSGSAEIAHLLQFHRVNYLAVAYTDEGIALRESGIDLPIMVMNPSPDSFEKLAEYGLEPEVYSLKILDELLEKHNSFNRAIHLKLDTGMHRLGFVETDLPLLIERLTKNKNLKIASIFSHLVGADEAQHSNFSKLQYERLMAWSDKIIEAIGYAPLRHILNSAGIVRFPSYKLDMVRLGIGLYGVEVNQIEQQKLQNVGTLKTIISQIKHLKAGETVGYGRRGLAKNDMVIATIAIGYADGFDRRWGNGVGRVMVNGTRCPVVGNVCMDMTMIDIGHITANEGDEVVIFGAEMPLTKLAHDIGTIPYEILTGVSERVKRIFFKEEN